MSRTLINDVVQLINNGWRPYNYFPDASVYRHLDCALYQRKGDKGPYWMCRGDIFLCLGCSRRCSLTRPDGFMMPLPIRYDEQPEEPYSLTPFEMVRRKALLRVDEVAYCLNIKERTVRDWIDTGKLRRVSENPVRVPSSDVLREMLRFDE